MKTKTGRLVTEEQLVTWADAFERGEWPEGKTVILGRPRLSAEELKSVTFKLSQAKLAALDEKAVCHGETRSEFLRSIVDEALASAS